MIQIIPEGKVQISGNASLKDQINGIPFTSQGYEVWVTKVVDEKDEKKQEELLDSLVERLVKTYYKKLDEELRSTRNEMIDNLRIELNKEYEEKLKKAKELIIKLKEENDRLKNK